MQESPTQAEPANANAPTGASEQLLSDLKSTPAKRLAKIVQRIDGLSPEEEEALERGDKLALRAKLRKLQGWSYHVIFCAGVVLTIGFVLSVFAMLGLYISKVNSEGKIEIVMRQILTFLAGVAVTLAIERFSKKEK
jgi:hypothetical protein